MMRANLRVLVLFAIASFSAVSAHAAGRTNPTLRSGQVLEPAPPYNSSRTIDEYQGLGIDRQLTVFAGTVLDVNDHALDKVLVQVFVDGDLEGHAVTDQSGFYEIKIPFNTHSDTTVLLWYVPLERTLLPKEIVIRESKASLANQLISRCVPRATFTPGRQFRVYLFDTQNRNKDLAELNCLP